MGALERARLSAAARGLRHGQVSLSFSFKSHRKPNTRQLQISTSGAGQEIWLLSSHLELLLRVILPISGSVSLSTSRAFQL